MFNFRPYQEIRKSELASGHDMILGSCLNLAGGPGVEDGEATYVGREDRGFHVFLCIDFYGAATLVSQNGSVIMSSFDLPDQEELLSNYEWACGAE